MNNHRVWFLTRISPFIQVSRSLAGKLSRFPFTGINSISMVAPFFIEDRGAFNLKRCLPHPCWGKYWSQCDKNREELLLVELNGSRDLESDLSIIFFFQCLMQIDFFRAVRTLVQTRALSNGKSRSPIVTSNRHFRFWLKASCWEPVLGLKRCMRDSFRECKCTLL